MDQLWDILNHFRYILAQPDMSHLVAEWPNWGQLWHSSNQLVTWHRSQWYLVILVYRIAWRHTAIFGRPIHEIEEIRGVRIYCKLGQIGPKLDKSGTFSDQISVHLAHQSDPLWSQTYHPCVNAKEYVKYRFGVTGMSTGSQIVTKQI